MLLVVVMLLQIFIFDRLMLSIAIAPLVYISFLILLPIQTPQLEMIFWSCAVGVAADILMGAGGVNTIATLFVGYIRTYLLAAILGKDLVALGGIPTASRVGTGRFVTLMSTMVLTHALLFFGVESLSITSWQFALQRFFASGATSLVFVTILTHFFGSLLMRKV